MDMTDFFFGLFLIGMGMIGGALFLWAWLVWPMERADRAWHLSGADNDTVDLNDARERHPTYYSGPAAMDEF